MQPLYGHSSPDTAYLVPDYPYGRTVRCRIRYWIEFDQRKGFRYCSQTERPGTSHWNAPKKSTYAAFGACMYLDEQGHVQCKRLSAYVSAEEAIAFVRDFPLADMSQIGPFAIAKIAYLRAYIEGRAGFTINGTPRPFTETEQARHKIEIEIWRDVARALGLIK